MTDLAFSSFRVSAAVVEALGDDVAFVSFCAGAMLSGCDEVIRSTAATPASLEVTAEISLFVEILIVPMAVLRFGGTLRGIGTDERMTDVP